MENERDIASAPAVVEPTPVPWRIVLRPTWIDIICNDRLAPAQKPTDGIRTARIRGTTAKDKANAALIVAAVNAYEPMRAEIERLREALMLARRVMTVSVTGISDGMTIHQIREWIKQADVALLSHHGTD